jgi:hypothetical protein
VAEEAAAQKQEDKEAAEKMARGVMGCGDSSNPPRDAGGEQAVAAEDVDATSDDADGEVEHFEVDFICDKKLEDGLAFYRVRWKVRLHTCAVHARARPIVCRGSERPMTRGSQRRTSQSLR